MSNKPAWTDASAMSVLGMGHALPGDAVSTDELLRKMALNFDVDVTRAGRVLARRLGVETRYVCREFIAPTETPRAGNSNAELAAHAISNALQTAGLRANDLSYLVAHTATPGQWMPPNVARVAELLEYDGPFVELRQACTGFANALMFASGLSKSPQCGPIAIVGSETGSVFFDPRRVTSDHGQLVNLLQMGDGAAACIVAPATPNHSTISHLYFGQIGRDRAAGFKLSQGADNTQHSVLEFEHNYAAVREAGPLLFEQGIKASASLGIDIHEVDYIVPHQANGRMAALLSEHIGVLPDTIFVNANRLGNTGSAAIWLALHDLQKRMRGGERALILGAEATKHMFGGFLYTHR